MQKIVFNKPYLSGNEIEYIQQAVKGGKTSGNQTFSKKCHSFFKEKFNFSHNLLTTSCTHALEMAALLLEVKAGDEIIMPSYTFVSTANAFVLKGAKIVFVDSCTNNPNIDPLKIEAQITKKTKAIVVMHYAGIACAMDAILAIARKYDLFVVEDAAQAIDSYYKGKALGTFGDFAAFSFHETKNIICGEGGLLVVNNNTFKQRSEIVWEKGTNRCAFHRGEIDKYNWVDVGSSFLMSDILAAYLFAQLQNLQAIHQKRKKIWKRYFEALKVLEEKNVQLPVIPDYATLNGHLFYLVCNDLNERTALIKHLNKHGIMAIFHYLGLHNSPYYTSKNKQIVELPNCEKFSNRLIRLPLYFELKEDEQKYIIDKIFEFYN